MICVTGQQISLLGGALYTTYKVLDAIKMAIPIKESKAVYWMEVNDADFREISSVALIDSKGGLKKLRWQKATGGKPIGVVKVDEKLLKLFKSYIDLLPQTGHTSDIASLLMDCFRVGEAFEVGSEKLARAIFSDFELTFFRPSEEGFRSFSQAFLRREIDRTEHGKQVGAFALLKGSRQALFKQGEQVFTRAGIEVNPSKEVLLPHLLTRSVIQDAYLKTTHYIAGPGEVAYLKNLNSQYAYHQVRAAQVVPRMSLTLIEPEVQDAFDELGIPLMKEVIESQGHFRHAVLLKEGTWTRRNYFQKLKNRVVYERKSMGLPWKAFERMAYRALKAESGSRRRVWKKSREDKLRLIKKIEMHLWPWENKQERVFNLFNYANKYGLKKIVHELAKAHDFNKKMLLLP